jgi:hypothetical protein
MCGEETNSYRALVGSPKERDHLENPGVDRGEVGEQRLD